MKFIIIILILVYYTTCQSTTDSTSCSQNSTDSTNVTCDTSETSSDSTTNLSTESSTEIELTSVLYDDEDDNSTVSSSSEAPQTENVTLAITNATTLQSNTTVAPTVVPTTPPPPPVFPSRDLDAVPCTCDLLVAVCDIGCCCDVDCSTEDRQVFSHCTDFRPPFPADPQLCHRSQWFYEDYQPQKSTLYKGGLLCLYRDNLPDRHWLDNPKVATTYKEFEQMNSRSSSIPWPQFGSITNPELKPGLPYKSGDLIWTLKNNKTIQPFALSDSIVSLNCESQKDILYLKNWKRKCNQILTANCESTFGSNNGSTYFAGIQVLVNPLEPLWNQSDPWLPIKPYICSVSTLHLEHPENCREVSSELPAPSLAETKCENSVLRVTYVIQHNGTEGIVSVKVYLWLGSQPKARPVTQTLEVIFEWVNSRTASLRRSGRPGYIQSWPVRAGALNDSKISVSPLNITGHSWLSTLLSGPSGHCNALKTRPILFNEDILSQCSVTLTEANFTRDGCTNITQNILQMMVGNSSIDGLVVAAFGDSEWDTLQDWVPVISKDIPVEAKWSEILINMDNKTEKSTIEPKIGYCSGIVTSLNIHFLWSSVGSLSSPQSKIIGVLYNFGETRTLEPPKNQQSFDFNLIVSISFTDITPKVHSKFAPLPKYEIRLPRDFFYPLFSTSNSRLPQENAILYFCGVLLLILFC